MLTSGLYAAQILSRPSKNLGGRDLRSPLSEIPANSGIPSGTTVGNTAGWSGMPKLGRHRGRGVPRS